MKPIYFDNAATTQIDKKVIKRIYNSMAENYGNPSSIHQFGRKAKAAIETSRINIAKYFNASPSEIIFTSGGTEADNLILYNAVINLKVKRIITSKIEHHAVLNTCKYLKSKYNTKIEFVKLDKFGSVDFDYLEGLLQDNKIKTLVSLMFVNNEIGTILDIDKVSELCKKNNSLFHSDTVQAITRYNIDLHKTPIDFIAASAHKFHGPKGIGFAFFRKNTGILPLLRGGSQEKGARAGTENVHAILGMEEAMSIAKEDFEKNKEHIINLKSYFIYKLNMLSKNIKFNGLSDDLNKSSYTILNVRFHFQNKLLIFNLDLAGIAASGGSACQSGSSKQSHVITEILNDEEAKKTSIRFSFSKYNTNEEIDFVLKYLSTFIRE